MAKKSKFTAEEIIEALRKECDNPTIEGELLRTKLIREMYKLVGEPEEKDFPDEYKTAGVCGWSKFKGYTTYVGVMTERKMKSENNAATVWRITYPSDTKRDIERRYTNDGWSCEVQSYNVICAKYVKHPKYKNLWVRFYCTRDCAKYELVLEMKDE